MENHLKFGPNQMWSPLAKCGPNFWQLKLVQGTTFGNTNKNARPPWSACTRGVNNVQGQYSQGTLVVAMVMFTGFVAACIKVKI